MGLLSFLRDVAPSLSPTDEPTFDNHEEVADEMEASSSAKLMVIVSPELVNRDPLTDPRKSAMAARYAASSQGHNVVTIALSSESKIVQQPRALEANFGQSVLVHVRSADELFQVLFKLARSERLSPTMEPLGRLTAVAMTHPLAKSVPMVLEQLDAVEMEVGHRIPRIGLLPDYAVQNAIGAETAARSDGTLSLPPSNQVPDEAVLRAAGFDRLVLDSNGRAPFLQRLATLLSASGLGFRRILQRHSLTEVPSADTLEKLLQADIVEAPLPSAGLLRSVDESPRSIVTFDRSTKDGQDAVRALISWGGRFIPVSGLDRSPTQERHAGRSDLATHVDSQDIGASL